MGTRFLYIDNRYRDIINREEKIILKNNEKMVDTDNDKIKDKNSNSEYLNIIYSSYKQIGLCESHQKNNRLGVSMDFVIMITLVSIMVVTISGFFDIYLNLLNVGVFVIFLLSVFHFAYHISVVEKNKSTFKHSK